MIPLILNKLIFNLTEAAIKYFIVQAIASIIFIVRTIFSANFLNFNYLNITELLIISALIIKAGIAPLHIWFPQIIIIINWFQCGLTVTWQKVAPLFLISHYYDTKIVYFFAISSIFVGCLGGFNQILVKLILTYSSIAHSGWIAALASCSTGILVNYFSIYVILTLSIIIAAIKTNWKNLSNMANSKISHPQKIFFSLRVLSLGGLPPFGGFIAKLSAVKTLILRTPPAFVMALILSSLFSLFFYFKLIINYISLANNETKFIFTNKNNKLNFWLNLRLLLNIIFPLIILAW